MNRIPWVSWTALALIAVLGALSVGMAPGAAGPATRDVVRLSVRTTVVGLDPKIETSSTVGAINSNVLESLVTMDYDGKIIPQLATEWRAESGTNWVFKLRPNVKFHDGTPFNAEAVRFSLERMADNESSHRGDFSWLAQVEILNPLTVRIRSKVPYAPMLSALAFYHPYIVSPTAVRQMGNQFGQKPVGTGPFKYDSHIPRQRTIMVRNDDYWGPKPKVSRAEWIIVVEDNARLAALLSGELDILTVIEPSIMQALATRPQFSVLRGPDDLVDRIGFNARKRPFDDVRVRRALIHGVNRNQMIATIFGGVGVAFDPPFAPGIVGFDSQTMGRLSYPYDPAKARALLAEAGFPNGFRTSFTIINRPDHRQIGEVVQADLKQIGVDVQLRALDFATVSQSTRQGEHDMYIIGTYGVGDPDRVLPEFESANFNVKNRNFWSDPEVDRLIQQQRQELDPQKRQAIVRQVAVKIRDAAPEFALRWRRAVLAINKNVKGYRVHPQKWYVRDVTVEQ
jgi:peptide/nickel transport system substrate-binding protein